MQSWLDDRRPRNCHGDEPLKNGEEMSLCRVGSDLYEKVFKHYTKKQWDKYPIELDASVLARLPGVEYLGFFSSRCLKTREKYT